jgi:hypothetical protein
MPNFLLLPLQQIFCRGVRLLTALLVRITPRFALRKILYWLNSQGGALWRHE